MGGLLPLSRLHEPRAHYHGIQPSQPSGTYRQKRPQNNAVSPRYCSMEKKGSKQSALRGIPPGAQKPCGAIFAQQNRASATLVPRENARRPWPCTFSMAYPFCGGPPPRGPPRLPRSAWPVQGGMLGPAPPVRTHCDLEFPFKGNADAESI